MAEHYFTPSPSSNQRDISVGLRLGPTTHTFTAPSGIFSPDGVDRGTRVLLDTVTSPRGSTLVDLGCGWGPVALTMAYANQEATVWAVDVNERALQAMKANATSLGLGRIEAITPEQFPANTAIDTLWSNPPIRIGKEALHELLQTWLNRLSPDGEAWLVVGKHLGADSLQRWLNELDEGAFLCDRVTTDKGFRVLKVSRR